MVKKLTLKQQRELVRALPRCRIMALKKHCQACEMQGLGLKDIMKKVGKFLGPIVKEIGPTVLKELIIPMLKSKAGLGLKLAGQGKGKGLRLAGQRY